MKEIFLQQLNQLKVSKTNSLILAVSGGIDSMVLLDLFAKNGYNFSVAHCNFNLRGNESQLDQKFIQKISKSHSIQFFNKQFNTLEYSKKIKFLFKWQLEN